MTWLPDRKSAFFFGMANLLYDGNSKHVLRQTYSRKSKTGGGSKGEVSFSTGYLFFERSYMI
jgi:hypothetical protein